jgi:hypothetical protein
MTEPITTSSAPEPPPDNAVPDGPPAAAPAAAPDAPVQPTQAPVVERTSPASDGADTVKRIGAVLANVTVITGLLIYFGWRRTESQAERLGIDESILGLSTKDYVLRSVGPVLVLLSIVAVGGLVWLWIDRVAAARRARLDLQSTETRWGFRLLAFAWLLLPLCVILLGFVWRRGAFVLFPMSIGLGVLLSLYGVYLRSIAPGGVRLSPQRLNVIRAFAALVACICLFWAASNYAELLGRSLADDQARRIGRLTSVVLYSQERMHIEAPGAREEQLPSAGESAYRYRTVGLRLLDHTGGTYFLVSDDWSPRYGVVVAITDDDTVRLEFVRDRRPPG